MTPLADHQTLVTARTSTGEEIRGSPSQMSQSVVVFEIFGGDAFLKASEVLDDFSISVGDRSVYAGRAVVRNMISTNLGLACEVSLLDHWLDSDAHRKGEPNADAGPVFDRLLRLWQNSYRIASEFKHAVTDLHGFLATMRIWSEQVEFDILRQEPADKSAAIHEASAQLCLRTTPALDNFFDRLEHCSVKIEPDAYPLHRALVRSQLHPLLLCSPFLHRTFHKPLGYAGDHEMVSMIMRDPFEGKSLYAQLVNHWFLQQAPAIAHRNRIDYLIQALQNLATRATLENRPARILNLGCGPAGEVQRFIAENQSADCLEFALLDFNDETLRETGNQLASLIRKHHRRTRIQMQKRSVQQILKEFGRDKSSPDEARYDLVYCAGLYDYLSDAVCQRVSTVLYNWTAPGGLFVATNVAMSNPRRMGMDFVMDWHVIHRTKSQLLTAQPTRPDKGEAVVRSEITGVNLFLEIPKPSYVR